MGYVVFDTDTMAKTIMDNSDRIKAEIVRLFGPETITANAINRPVLANIVFNDSSKLEALNKTVHSAVIESLLTKYAEIDDKIIFAETSIVYQCGLDKYCDCLWEVTAPNDLRVSRVMKRNSVSADDVRKRIAAQIFTPSQPHPHVYIIVNDDITPLLPQINFLLAGLT